MTMNPEIYAHKTLILADKHCESGTVTINRSTGLTIGCSEGMAQMLVAILTERGILRTEHNPPVASVHIQDVRPTGPARGGILRSDTEAQQVHTVKMPTVHQEPIADVNPPEVAQEQHTQIGIAQPGALPDTQQAPAKRGRKPRSAVQEVSGGDLQVQETVIAKPVQTVMSAVEQTTVVAAVQEAPVAENPFPEHVSLDDPGIVEVPTVMALVQYCRERKYTADQLIEYLRAHPGHQALEKLAPALRDVDKLASSIRKTLGR